MDRQQRSRLSTGDDPDRPGYHFTAPVGWINDPLGVTWHVGAEGGQYELFFQFNPGAPVWAPECRWGQATSPDLVRWAHPRTALEPSPDETGCWSGSVVVDNGVPIIVYTSVLADSLSLGRVALAHGDAEWQHWSPDPAGPVIPAPGPETELAHLRDPYVWRDGDRWRLLLGAGSTDRSPSVRQYSSADLRHWQFDGVLARAGRNQGPGGAVWECPQLFQLDGAWVLVVSVWNEGPRGVAAAVGDYDGRRFTARSWHTLAPEPIYGTTTFADAAGRRCAISWIPEEGESDASWAGALSVPWLLARDGDRVVVEPHPDVDTLHDGREWERADIPLSHRPLVLPPLGVRSDVAIRADPVGQPLQLILEARGKPWVTLTIDAAAGVVGLSVPGRAQMHVPLRAGRDGDVELRLLLDVDVVEIFPEGGSVAGLRLPAPGGRVGLMVTGGSEGRLQRITVDRMEAAIG